MERTTLDVEKREKAGKGVARTLRRGGMIPAVLYREGKSLPISISKKAMAEFITATSGEHTVVSLKFADGKNKLAILKDYQVDPVKGEILHTDFFEVSLKEKINVRVRVITKGESIGVKNDGGILQHVMREVEIECLPDNIPGHFEVSIAHLGVGQSIHVKDISFEKDIKVLTDLGEVIATVIAPLAEKEEAAPADGVVAAPETAEPEVIKKGKKEEETEVKEDKKQADVRKGGKEEAK